MSKNAVVYIFGANGQFIEEGIAIGKHLSKQYNVKFLVDNSKSKQEAIIQCEKHQVPKEIVVIRELIENIDSWIIRPLSFVEKLVESIGECDIFYIHGMLPPSSATTLNIFKKFCARRPIKSVFKQEKIYLYIFFALAYLIQNSKRAIAKIVDYNEQFELFNKYFPNLDIVGIYAMDYVKKFYDIEFSRFSVPIDEKDFTKDNIFTFGFTAHTQGREWLYDFVKNNILPEDGFIVHQKLAKKYNVPSNLVSYSEYCKELARSKFTFILPATDPHHVSIARVYEAIARHCVPIFHERVFTTRAFSYEMSRFIYDNLTYRPEKHGSLNEFAKSLNYEALDKKMQSFIPDKWRNISSDYFIKAFETGDYEI